MNEPHVTFRPENLLIPFRWKKEKTVHVCPEGDPFHKNLTDLNIFQMFAMMESLPQHNFVVVTKWPERMHDLLAHPEFGYWVYKAGIELLGSKYLDRGKDWGNNIIIGVSIEDNSYIKRAEVFKDLPETITRAIFASPFLGPLTDISSYSGFIDWMVCGAERGAAWGKPRYCDDEWIKTLKRQCNEAEVPFLLIKKYSKKWVQEFGGTWLELPPLLDPNRVPTPWRRLKKAA